jgi:siroheme synthase-like protein
MFPVFLNTTDRLAVVVGGGPVGRRKVEALLAADAKVRLVCLDPPPADVDTRVEWRQESYHAGHLDGAVLVFAAATAEVNRRVIADARARQIWVNAAHDPAAGDFFVPSTVRRGEFVVAIGTGGAAPALARAVRTHLEEHFDEAFGQWVELLGELRPVVMERIGDPERRQQTLVALCDWQWLERLRRDGVDAVRAQLTALVLGNNAPL